MKRKILSILALLCLTVNSAWADPEILGSGTCGDGIYWELTDDAVLTVSGSGIMADYETGLDVQPWSSVRDYISRVEIESGVTHIGEYAFEHCIYLTKVNIPASVTSIGEGAFQYTHLSSVDIPDGVTSIHNFTFLECKLASVDIPDGVTSIGYYAFAGCNNLTTVNIPDGVTSIGESAFFGCTSLETVNIPASVTSIGEEAFGDCIEASITLNSYPVLGENVFLDCGSVTMNLTAHEGKTGEYWTTFFNNQYSFVADVKTEVFKVALSGTELTLNKIDSRIVDANVPVVLKTTDGNPVLVKTSSPSSDSQGNSLNGVSVAGGVTADGTFYVLNKGSKGVGFYKLSKGNKIGYGKAYLINPGGGGGYAPEFFLFEDDATSINEVLRDKNEELYEGAIYNVAGQCILKMQKGINIVNGKKIIK